MGSREMLIGLVLKYRGSWKDVMADIQQRKGPEEEFLEQAKNLKCNVVTILDEDYPRQLKNIIKPPFVLFYYGDIKLVSDYYKNVSIVGSRECSEYGSDKTMEIAGDLAEQGYVIVSGMAKGIDSIAHEAAIKNKGKTVAILGSGIDYCYPLSNTKLYKEIKKNHLLISEYPGNEQPAPSHFPIRNRIIAGLSKTLIVAEAKYQSGSLITALLALEGNADVMCLPYRAGENSECNRLIMHGAILVENAKDVVEQMSEF